MTDDFRRGPGPLDPAKKLADARAVLDKAVPEATFQQQVIDLAKTYRWLVYHTHDSRFSERGFPDLVCVKGGVMLGIELKKEGAVPTPAQDRWLDELGAVPGVRTMVARPSDFEALKDILATAGVEEFKS